MPSWCLVLQLLQNTVVSPCKYRGRRAESFLWSHLKSSTNLAVLALQTLPRTAIDTKTDTNRCRIRATELLWPAEDIGGAHSHNKIASYIPHDDCEALGRAQSTRTIVSHDC